MNIFNTVKLQCFMVMSLLCLGALCGCNDGEQEVTDNIMRDLDIRVSVMDRTHLLIQIDPSLVEDKVTLARLAMMKLGDMPAWKKTMMQTYACAKSIEQVRADLLFKSVVLSHHMDDERVSTKELIIARGGGTWISAKGRKRISAPSIGDKPSDVIRLNLANVQYEYFVEVPELINHESYTLTFPTGNETTFTVDIEKNPSKLFKLDQVGYLPDAPVKEIYLGAWMGSGGAFPMLKYNNRFFSVVDAVSDRVVLQGQLHYRTDMQTNNRTPITGEETMLADISSVRSPGRYYCNVDGIGRSPEFEVRANAMADAFFTHMYGLYSQRCGGACHADVYRGHFPSQERYYTRREGAKPDEDGGFFDEDGKSITVDIAKLLKADKASLSEHPERIYGGWHDGMGYDRRSYHLPMIKALCMVYKINRNAFQDGQLYMPEQRNGIPDILDEASWGLNLWRQLQTPSGSVPVWVTTGSYPEEPLAPEDDHSPCYVATPTRESTFIYIAQAATLAKTLRVAGAEAAAEVYEESALRAWEFAKNPQNRVKIEYTTDGKDGLPKKFYFIEPASPTLDLVADAVLSLYSMDGGNEVYLSYLSDEEWIQARQANWRTATYLDPLRFAQFALTPGAIANEGAEQFHREWRRQIIAQADILVRRMNGNPYHGLWLLPEDPNYGSMQWGQALPLRHAVALALAWRISGGQKYYQAALQAINFHQGLNPLGLCFTSGLGKSYPARYYSFNPPLTRSYGAGITPYRTLADVPPPFAALVMGLHFPARKDLNFNGMDVNFSPWSGKMPKGEAALMETLARKWPVERRFANIETLSPRISGYSVWETIIPAIITTGLLLPDMASCSSFDIDDELPTAPVVELPGYWNIP